MFLNMFLYVAYKNVFHNYVSDIGLQLAAFLCEFGLHEAKCKAVCLYGTIVGRCV